MEKNFLFTSESVSAGHPDKVCDCVSDTIVDAILNQGGDVRAIAQPSKNNGNQKPDRAHRRS